MNRLAVGLGIGLAAIAMLFACVGSDPERVDDDEKKVDAATGTDSGPVGGGTNVLKRGSFDEDTCPNWSENGVTKEIVSESHDGARSCKVCIKEGVDYQSWAIYQTILPLPVGAYRLTAWVHPYGDRGPAIIGAAAQAVDAMEMPKGEEQRNQVENVPTDTWQTLSVDVLHETEGGGITVAFVGADSPQGCFLVDAAVLALKPQ